jgi:hypothetical protein
MAINALKLFSAIALVILSTGALPHPRYGTAIAIGLCIAAAIVLHFAAQ